MAPRGDATSTEQWAANRYAQVERIPQLLSDLRAAGKESEDESIEPMSPTKI